MLKATRTGKTDNFTDFRDKTRQFLSSKSIFN